MSANSTKPVEKSLTEYLLSDNKKLNTASIFIVASPRTGSTIIYQAISARYNLPYISNFTNEYYSLSPIVGLAIQKGLTSLTNVGFSSAFGKTSGLFQPSEASDVMRQWFGGGHPSQIMSSEILPGKEDSFISTVSATNELFLAPLVIKNAWNCFRIENIAKLLPDSYFIWVRRNISCAAKSDLNARYKVQGSPNVWNSATPYNVDALMDRPYWEQVVENQYEFNSTIGKSLDGHAENRFSTIWYEDFCDNPIRTMNNVAQKIPIINNSNIFQPIDMMVHKNEKISDLSSDDNENIERYINDNSTRFRDMIREI